MLPLHFIYLVNKSDNCDISKDSIVVQLDFSSFSKELFCTCLVRIIPGSKTPQNVVKKIQNDTRQHIMIWIIVGYSFRFRIVVCEYSSFSSFLLFLFQNSGTLSCSYLSWCFQSVYAILFSINTQKLISTVLNLCSFFYTKSFNWSDEFWNWKSQDH